VTPWEPDRTAAVRASIREFRPTEDFEGRARGRSGFDRTRSFVMTMLDGPPRPVVDIAG
jgi:hypothetical protein